MGQEGTISDIDGVSSHWVHFSGCHEVLEKQPVFHASIIRRLLFFEDRILCHQIISLAVLLTSGTVCSRSTIHTVSQTLYRAIDFNRSARHPLAITSHHITHACSTHSRGITQMVRYPSLFARPSGYSTDESLTTLMQSY